MQKIMVKDVSLFTLYKCPQITFPKAYYRRLDFDQGVLYKFSDRIGSEFWKQAELIGDDDTGIQYGIILNVKT